jgi:hypothetical protein
MLSEAVRFDYSRKTGPNTSYAKREQNQRRATANRRCDGCKCPGNEKTAAGFATGIHRLGDAYLNPNSSKIKSLTP